jgi:hypothetical protein
VQHELRLAGAGEQQGRGAAIVAMAERRMAEPLGRERAREFADQRRGKARRRLALGEHRLERGTVHERRARRVAIERRQHVARLGHGLPATAGRDHRRLGLALERGVTAQRVELAPIRMRARPRSDQAAARGCAS